MTEKNTEIVASAPGRVCLFGEHQDYLNLPVIASAISLRVNVSANRKKERSIFLDLPDIKSKEEFHLNGRLKYEKERDYFRSAINVLQNSNFTFSNGLTGIVNGNIPINSGTSSSSALMVAWIKLLAELSDQAKKVTSEQIAELAYQAEVLEFNEPGGKMDMYTSAIGGTVFLDFHPKLVVEKLPFKLGTFVLGDSNEPKDTKGILSRVKDPILEILKIYSESNPSFSLRNITPENIEDYKYSLSNDQFRLLYATVNNYHITKKARSLLQNNNDNHKEIGNLLTKHHQILRDDLKISTPKIEKMIDAALDANAYGAKINGSGGGGCMFAYAPNNPEKVAENIEKAGGKAYIINTDNGVYSKFDG